MKLPSWISPCLAAVFLAGAQPSAFAAASRIITGSDSGAGGGSHAKAFTRNHTNVASFFPYTPSFTGGVRVAAGDVNGDGAPDIITGTGPGAAHVKVLSGRTLAELHSFLPYGSGFSGGIFVAAGDVNGDGRDDIITGVDTGTAGHVKVFDGSSGAEIRSFFAYPVAFTGGVRVAAGDVNGDGTTDIITGAGPGGGPHVKAFDGKTLAELRSFLAYDPSFSGGVLVAAGDITGDGRAELVTGSEGAPHVKVFDGATMAEVKSFFAYDPQFTGGVRVAVGDIDGDGRAEVHTSPGSGAAPHVRIFNGSTGNEVASFFAYDTNFMGGVFIAAASVKRPQLEILSSASSQSVRLQWPSGCLCELEENEDVSNPRAWKPMDIQAEENDTRIGLLLPAVQKVRAFRLNCDIDKLR